MIEKHILLSIDFDFFVRELPEWEWGHRESKIFLNTVWPARYASRPNLIGETDPRIYADFVPRKTPEAMRSKGIHFPNRYAFGVSESHLSIIEFINGLPRSFKPDMVLNLDAHHDAFNEIKENGLDCGNWHTAIHDRWPDIQHVQIVPCWQDSIRWHGSPVRPIQQMYWRDLNLHHLDNETSWVIGAMFICRSGCWVPPHLDNTFNQMVGRWQSGEPMQLPVRPRNEQYIKSLRAAIQEAQEHSPKELEGMALAADPTLVIPPPQTE